jgi:hypothetical protein
MAKKKSRHSGGSSVTSGSASDTRTRPHAPSQSRGDGSSFAFAIKDMMEDASQMKGSKSEFLGVPSEILDPKQYAHSLTKK